MQKGIKTGAKPEVKTLLSKEALAKAEAAVKLIDSSKIPEFQRSGNQKYVFMDSSKDPYTGGYTVEPGYKTEIHTDGKLVRNRKTMGGGKTEEFYTVSGYEYIIVKTSHKGVVISQEVITTDLRFKLYMQQLLGLPRG